MAKRRTKLINTKTKVTFAVWITGLLIWFSDYANALLIGPIFQPIADKLKMSREKLACNNNFCFNVFCFNSKWISN